MRLLNIPMEKSTVFNGLPNCKAHADALKEAWAHSNGAAGRDWVKWLATHQQEAKQVVRTRRRAGEVSFRLIMVNRYTAWPNALPSLKRLW